MSQNNIDREQARRMLRDIAEMSQEASLTGMLSGGASRAIARYNGLIEQINAAGLLPSGLFQPLPDTASFAELGVDARMAASALKNGDGEGGKRKGGKPFDMGVVTRLAPFVGKDELRDMVREAAGGRGVDPDMLMHLAPFLDSETLSQMVREYMRGAEEAPEPPQPAPAPVPTPAPAPAPVVVPPVDRTPVVAPNEELSRLAARLAEPNLAPDERSEIAIRLSELALHQGQIAREGE